MAAWRTSAKTSCDAAPERIAVEVDDASGQGKATAEGAQRVGLVHGLDGREIGKAIHDIFAS
jgi:hypothetical protein